MASSRNPSPSPSISSTITDITSGLNLEEAELRNFVKKRLSKRLFLGHYQERRYVDPLRVYRDMIVLDKSETELQVDLERVQSKINSFYRGEKWLGITSPDTIGAPAGGHCLWTKLQDTAFGFYWFQIRQVRFEENAVEIRLKVIRRVNEEVVTPAVSAPSLSQTISDNVDTLKSSIRTSIYSFKESTNQGSPTKVKQPVPENEKVGKGDSDPVLEKHTTTVEDIKVLSQVIIHNWKEIFMFISMAVVGTVNGLAKCVEFVGNFSLKFMHEFSFLMGTITPIILAVIELVGKVIGGLYILMAMLFRGNGPPPPPQQVGRPQLLSGRPSPQFSGPNISIRPARPRNYYSQFRGGYNRM